MNRRGFLQSILFTGVAPAIIRLPGLLMPINVKLVGVEQKIISRYRWYPFSQIPQALVAGWQIVEAQANMLTVDTKMQLLSIPMESPVTSLEQYTKELLHGR